MARLAVVAVWVVLSVGIWRWPRRGLAGFDASYALAWSRDLYRGHTGTLPAGAPTPHPLGILLSLPLNLGQASTAPTVAAAAAGYAAAVLVFALLAFNAVSGAVTARLLAAGITVWILMCSPKLMLLPKQASPDVWFILIVGLAAAAYLAGRPCLAVVLFALASLQRPEAWLFGAAAVIASRHPSPSDDSMGEPKLWRYWMPLVIPPAVWLAMGTWFGQPLAGLKSSRDNAEALHRSTGFGDAVTGLAPGLASGVGWAAVAIGTLWALLIWRHRLPGSLRPSVVAFDGWASTPKSGSLSRGDFLSLLLLIDAAFFLVQGILGVALLPRYLAVAQFLLAAPSGIAVSQLTSSAIKRWRHLPKPLRPISAAPLAALSAALALTANAVLAITGAARTSDYQALNDVLRTQHEVEGSLARALNHAPARAAGCGDSYTTVLAQTPVIALQTGQPLSALRVYLAPTITHGTVVFAKDRLALDGAGFGPAQPPVDRFPVPDGFAIAANDTHWAVLQRC